MCARAGAARLREHFFEVLRPDLRRQGQQTTEVQGWHGAVRAGGRAFASLADRFGVGQEYYGGHENEGYRTNVQR